MSDTIKIKMNSQEYNALYSVVSQLTGTFSKVAASKAVELIKEGVTANAKSDTELPEAIVVDFPKKVLDGLYFGLTEKIKDEKVNTQDVLQLKAIASLLKMKTRFEKFIDKEIESISADEEEFDAEEIETPFDDEVK